MSTSDSLLSSSFTFLRSVVALATFPLVIMHPTLLRPHHRRQCQPSSPTGTSPNVSCHDTDNTDDTDDSDNSDPLRLEVIDINEETCSTSILIWADEMSTTLEEVSAPSVELDSRFESEMDSTNVILESIVLPVLSQSLLTHQGNLSPPSDDRFRLSRGVDPPFKNTPNNAFNFPFRVPHSKSCAPRQMTSNQGDSGSYSQYLNR
ncbi:hypothetical protein CONPUDRAFT_155369 [Coniophora puteana RWD-64-598 SS2]|uniref:Uncharacterized protein n=1 Tax=Coniophora puteana (strain RWD-64-598) TaxID=741705 RepID=A0A5M3MLP8_CONPW|nr:uncharacterized protein CONPUDRAFT_155369 [Coniophora puteana RWD-64-598 SS2]EIW79986.1 hypothetical protein CONPUDRAFT_155369 [Coniophora puteana RWD-64-598 SS2]